MENNKYKFKQFEHGLIAFISNFEKKINQIIEIPVLVLETGDETYWFKNKFEAKPENLNELYQKIPRLILTIDEASLQSDQDTNQYVKILYQIDNETFKSQARRKAITFPFQCNLVSSNFITALEHFEILLSILSVDNVFTYEFLGNTYQGSFNATNFAFEKTPLENGGTKNFVIKATLDVQLQPFILKYESIQNVNENEPKETVIGIITNNHDLTRTDYILEDEDTEETD
jgi:hypothetical protein